MSRATRSSDLLLPVEREHPTRRSFLKLAGYGVATATLAGCSRGPLSLVVPRPAGAAGVVPGRAYSIATTCDGCDAACGILARCRDGRPVKLEGNPDHALSRGGLCAVGQASVLDLYDGRRLDGPLLNGNPAEWGDVDTEVQRALDSGGAGVRILTRTVTSPSTRAWIDRVVKRTGGVHVEVDTPSCSALLDAHAAAFGRRVLPRMRFDRAQVIASFDADFLGTWIAPVEFTKAYREGRDPDAPTPRMSRHVQIESRLSLTGCSADTRLVVAPWEIRSALQTLVAELAKHSAKPASIPVGTTRHEEMAALANELWAARGTSLVVCGTNDPAAQALAVLANQLLGNYDRTLGLDHPSLQRRGDDAALAKLIEDMRAGAVKVLLIHGRDPLDELPEGCGFAEELAKVGLVVTTSARQDATAAAAHVVAPAPHRLESWDDAEPVDGHLSLAQPTVPPLRSARTLRASLARWSGDLRDDRELLSDHWREHVLPRSGWNGAVDAFLDRVLHDGHVEMKPKRGPAPAFRRDAVEALVAGAPSLAAPPAGEMALVLFPKVALPESRHAHNPWLQEVPDPLTTVTWDNSACLAPETAAELGLEDGDVVRVEADGASIELPVRVQPGQHPRAVAVALAYGVEGTERFARVGPSWLEGRLTVREGERVGRRAAPFAELRDDGCMHTSGLSVRLSATGEHEDVATTQDHHSLEVPHHLAVPRGAVRDHAREASFAKWRDDPDHALHRHEHASTDLWPADHASDGPNWGLAVDLSACNGCSGCVVACQAENNVPCVGKDEVRRHREMTWLRVDRYFAGDGDDLRVAHQPMMCQHCGNAPCETVCPVLATARSSDGLNQQVYNRCVGTRYCANNCPYKVRRFNWFDYPRTEELRNLALNPDVTVRSRGVMEKCSMCVQRIQEAKAEAARTGREVADGEVATACQQSCPADAITFGDLNDPDSAVARLAHSRRSYVVLGELNVKPGVTYLARIRNAPETEGGGSHE